MQRKLAAILAADVVGYSRLMEADEADTLARLKSTRTNLIDPKITAHGGRIVKLMGDGALIEFPSVVDAINCAADIQRTMADCNAGLPEEKRLEFRIAVNLGDVMIEGEDIYGDAVNVAARLQSLGDPGGVMISGTAFDQVEKKLDYGFEFLGERKLKNIEKPVRLYRIEPRAQAAATGATTKGKDRSAWRWPAIAAAALMIAAAGVVLGGRLDGIFGDPADVASMEKMALPLPDKPSIAVLPFTNMSGDANQQFFVDGMTDSLITDLSKVSDLFVIARNSTFVYQGKPVKVGQVAEELGVRYVLEGSVQRAGDELRVNAQLIDALSGGHVWADRFDGDVADIFATQDAFVAKIVEALQVRLTAGEKQQMASGKTANLEAKEAFDEGWSLYLRSNPKDTMAAIAPLKRAIELDPEFGRAYAALAMVHFRIKDSLWYKESGSSISTSWFTALEYVELAKKHPTPLSHTLEALRDGYQGHAEAARRNAGRAIALDPNDPEGHIAMAWALTISGQPDEALNFIATAMRLNPNYPSHYALARGTALFATGDLEQAAHVFEEGIERNPHASMLYVPLSSVLAQLGRREEATGMLQRFRPGVGASGLASFADTYTFPFKWDYQHAAVWERLYDGLRVAGLPPDVTVASLEKEIRDGNPIARMYATRRVGWFGPAAAPAVPALIETLENDQIRREAILALGKVGPAAKPAVPALMVLENEVLLRNDVRDALAKIGGD